MTSNSLFVYFVPKDVILDLRTCTCLCRWRPETHSFHLPCGEMIVTLQDAQKFLGLSIRGRPVTSHRAGGRELRPSSGDHCLQRRLVLGLLEYLSPGSERTLVSVRSMLTPRQSRSTVELGSCTCSAVFSSRMPQVIGSSLLHLCPLQLLSLFLVLNYLLYAFLHRGQHFLDVPPLPVRLGHSRGVHLRLRSPWFLVPQPLRGMSPHFMQPINWRLCLPSAGLDVVPVTGWPSAGSSSASLVRCGRQSSSTHGCLLMGPGPHTLG